MIIRTASVRAQFESERIAQHLTTGCLRYELFWSNQNIINQSYRTRKRIHSPMPTPEQKSIENQVASLYAGCSLSLPSLRWPKRENAMYITKTPQASCSGSLGKSQSVLLLRRRCTPRRRHEIACEYAGVIFC